MQAVSAKLDELAQMAPLKSEPLSCETKQNGEYKKPKTFACKAAGVVTGSPNVPAAAAHHSVSTCTLTAVKAEDDAGDDKANI